MGNLSFDEQVKLAVNFFFKEDYKKAFRHYEKALSDSPSSLNGSDAE